MKNPQKRLKSEFDDERRLNFGECGHQAAALNIRCLFSCLSILMEQICPIPNEKRYYTYEIVNKGKFVGKLSHCWPQQQQKISIQHDVKFPLLLFIMTTSHQSQVN